MFAKESRRGCMDMARGMPNPAAAIWCSLVGVLALQLVAFCLVGGYTATFHLLRGCVRLFPLWLFALLCENRIHFRLHGVVIVARLFERDLASLPVSPFARDDFERDITNGLA